ncbi:putative selenium-binding protein [Hordeum vulgare]|nr:putative selenium-binding protein [Hordeum vulgare]
MKVLLLASGDEKAPVAAVDGTLKLLRLVVSVEKYGKLLILLAVVERKLRCVSWCLRSKEAGRSHGMLDFGFCKMEIEVACFAAAMETLNFFIFYSDKAIGLMVRNGFGNQSVQVKMVWRRRHPCGGRASSGSTVATMFVPTLAFALAPAWSL